MDKDKVTIRDLQTFIDAVEFASDQEEWVPSPRQWKRIREMISKLEDAPAVVERPQLYSPMAGVPQMAPHALHAPMQAPASTQQIPPMPAGPSAFVAPAVPAGPQYHFGGIPAQPHIPAAFNTPRTPDIDTTGGKPYTSSFA